MRNGFSTRADSEWFGKCVIGATLLALAVSVLVVVLARWGY
jgi:hypothetical protein